MKKESNGKIGREKGQRKNRWKGRKRKNEDIWKDKIEKRKSGTESNERWEERDWERQR